MLRHTFCHVPGIGPGRERRLWDQGVRSWEDATGRRLAGQRGRALALAVPESLDHLARGDARYFAHRLPSAQQWRLFGEFRARVAYFDIETTGLGRPDDHVTTIALYDGRTVRHYVQGVNLGDFEVDVAAYDVLATYNGRSFDVPFVRRFMGVRLDQAHIDLMYVLRGLGYRGGLKGVERTLGLARPGMEEIDGFLAVLLWRDYQRTRDPAALETLLAYNVQDVLSLEQLMVFAYNRLVEATPFAAELRLPDPSPAANPFRPHQAVIDRVTARWVDY